MTDHQTSADVVLCLRGVPIASAAHQPGEGTHLRLGRLFIASIRSHPEVPRIDGCTTTMVYEDRAAIHGLADLALEAEEIARGGELVGTPVVTGWVGRDAVDRLVRLATARHDGELRVQAGGVALRLTDRVGVAITIVGHRVPFTARWRPRFLLARARWVLAGRPDPKFMAPTVGGCDADRGAEGDAVPSGPSTPFLFDRGVR